MMKKLIKNARVVFSDRVTPPQSVLIEDGRIAAFDVEAECPILDAEGGFLLAGFIDLHVHGGGGADFMDATVEAFETAVSAHLKHGTTLLYPTALTSTEEELTAFIDAFHQFRRESALGAVTPGVHLEGPYFYGADAKSRGAQKGDSIRMPDSQETDRLLKRGAGTILRWDAAPELPGIDTFAAQMRDAGIITAVAHTDATAEQTQQAYEWGFSHVTHFYNATSSHRKRGQTVYGGVVEATYLNDDVTVELIGDGCHIPKPELLLAVKVKGAQQVSVITDAMRIAGTDLTEGKLGSLKNGTDVVVEDDVAKLVDRTVFAGSIATMDRCLRTICRKYELPLTLATVLLSEAPARRMGIAHRKGSIEIGKDADLVIVDDALQVQRVIVGGEVMV